MADKEKDAVQGLKNIYSANSDVNALDFFVKMMQSKISTALPVKVVSTSAGGAGSATGYVDVLPLVAYINGSGNTVQPVNLYHLPYCRMQGGVAAVVVDPVPGDIGIAVFAQADSSRVSVGTSSPQPPGSFRRHSQSDGFYIGGFLNRAPSCYLELTQDNKAILHASGGVHIVGDTVINGNTTINGNLSVNGNSTMQGTINSTGDIVAAGISVDSHVHGGVMSGGGTTSGPQ